ncbi:hypothetical protein GCM10011428_57430 [Streptomyces violaceus]
MGHRAEHRDRCQSHDEADDREDDILGLVDRGQDLRHLGVPEVQQGGTHQAGQDQDLEQLVVGEGADETLGQRMEEEFGRRGQMLAAGRLLHGGGVQRGGVDVHALAGPDEVGGEETDDQGDRGGDLEPDQGLDPDPAEGLQITGLGDADDDHAEHQRRDHGLDEAGETVAERLESCGRFRPQLSDDDSENERAENLREKRATQCACDTSRQRRYGRWHEASLGDGLHRGRRGLLRYGKLLP